MHCSRTPLSVFLVSFGWFSGDLSVIWAGSALRDPKITLKSPLNHPKDTKKTVKRVSEHCIFGTLHNFPYILLMFLGYLCVKWRLELLGALRIMGETARKFCQTQTPWVIHRGIAVVSPTSRFAYGHFAYVLGRFAYVSKSIRLLIRFETIIVYAKIWYIGLARFQSINQSMIFI